jgi:hypothetical protein
MSAAIEAKTARARAGIAARLMKTVKKWPEGHGLGRNFDDCFEMSDGEEVRRLLIVAAVSDDRLLDAMIYHGFAEDAISAVQGAREFIAKAQDK